MADLPYATHRSLIEYITRSNHIRKIFIKRFLKFVSKLRETKKPVLQRLLDVSMNTTKSTTGKNLRGIMLETNATSIDELTPDIFSVIEYYPVDEDDMWKAEMIDHLLVELEDNILDEEDRSWMEYLCTD